MGAGGRHAPSDLMLQLVVHPRELRAARARAAVARALASGALDAVQLRVAQAEDARDAERAARELRTLLDASAAPRGRPALVLNAPQGLASALLDAGVRADGCHLKERELQAESAAERVLWLRTRRLRVSCAVHSVDAAVAAARLGADALQVGTMFPTASHPEKIEVEGPRLLTAVRAALAAEDPDAAARTPLVAIGGISTAEHVRAVVAAGADGVAVIRAVLQADDPLEAALELRAALDSAQDTVDDHRRHL